VAATLFNLAELCLAQDRASEAEPLYVRSLAIAEKVFGPDHPVVADILDEMMHCYEKRGKEADARRCRDRAESLRSGGK
jgi:lipopolysaccharide biosynthesis regulator YciM